MSEEEKKVSQEQISKALSALQDLAKGHNSRGTATTAVETMRDGSKGAGSSAGSTQVFHTPSNSDPKTWAGTSQYACPEDGATDAISDDGTDYAGGAQMMKSILEKLAKGYTVTAEELEVVKGAMAYAMKDKDKEDSKKARMPKDDEEDSKKGKKDADKKDKFGEDDEDMGKSLVDHAQQNATVNKGLEVSEFLSNWADVQNRSQESTESRIVSRVVKSLHAEAASTNEYQTQLAKAISNLGEVLTVQAQRIEQLESTPARGPKSAQVAPIEKSFGGPAGGEPLSKSQVTNTLIELVQKGQLPATEVIKYESTNILSPSLENKVREHRNGR